MTTAPSTRSQDRTHRPAPRRRQLQRRLSRTALGDLVRGAATAIRTALAGWLTAQICEHL
ncbi:hypothetical protein [Streptomyces sp. GS7]|uniref:hypothetical protein n=1 Tax=Streptomyces sp. GS7 TaxID=2692234 RepID=UPI001315F5EB|nr:hypothetical protein [Streptomyces sp. GS7]QHC23343.1 hypothetical protein GR130_20035 [Streptomyces sp. GS7]